MSTTPPPESELRVRARDILKVRRIWILPLALAAIFVALMSTIYLGSVVNPTGHLHGLPVVVVNEDTGAAVHGRTVNIGDEIIEALEGSRQVSSELTLTNRSYGQAKVVMNRAGAYATLVLPSTLTRSVLANAGLAPYRRDVPVTAAMTLEENSRLGSVGVSLASRVLTAATAKISARIGRKLTSEITASGSVPSTEVAGRLKHPVAIAPAQYRELPDHSALGLSAFYAALLAMMAGFIGGTLIHSSVDSALGYAATEVGPRRSQRVPVRINRLHTFIVKWCLALLAAPLLTGILVLISTQALHMYAPNWLALWALLAFASVMIATGTLALLATFGALGQMLAMILLIYLSLASSGGTTPIQALPGFFKLVAHVEPLRQVLDGVRAILYFDARGDAGLTHSLIMIGCELAFWAIIGLGMTAWYDYRKLYRIAPSVLSYVEDSVARHTHGEAPAGASPSPSETVAATDDPADAEDPVTPDQGLLAFGDSITNGGGELQWGVALQSWAQWLSRSLGLPFTNYAVDGARTADVVGSQIPAHRRLNAVPRPRYQLGCLYIGVNDVRSPDWRAVSYERDYADALDYLHGSCDRVLAVTIPLDLGRPPAGAKVVEANAVIERQAGRTGALLLRLGDFSGHEFLMFDHVHPTAMGQIAIAEQALDVLAEAGFQPRTRPRTLAAPQDRSWDRARASFTYGYRALKQRARSAGQSLRRPFN